MKRLIGDIRYGLRSFLKRPAFAAIVVLTVAIGIGATTAIFSVVNAVVLRRLPYRNAQRIVAIEELNSTGRRVQVTPANFLDWRAQNKSFEHLAAIFTRPANLALSDQAERIDIAVTSANFFSVFGAEALQGRLFIPEDEQAGHPAVAIVSHNLWQRRFGSDPQLVGKTITLDGRTYSVIGIAPQGFQYPEKVEVWLPPLKLAPELNETMDVTQVRGLGFLSAVALLKPGVSLSQAAAEMETITERLRQQYPDTNNKRFNRVISLQKYLIGETSTMLWLLFGAVGFVLIIACANVANLLLARSASRQKEMAIREALGASRWRVIQQVLTESTMLALAGGALGLFLAWWSVALMGKLLPQDFPRASEITVDFRVLGFTLLASLATGLLFGLAPALQLSGVETQESLKETGRGSSTSRRHNRLRGLLIISEVALSVVLLAGAGLLFRSFIQLQSVAAGFDPQQVLTVRVSPSGTNYRNDSDYITFYNRVLDRTASIPGVQSVGAINTLPLEKGPTASFRIEGRPATTRDKWPSANFRGVSDDYFRTMKIPLAAGRTFNAQDRDQSPLVIIINQALARENFANEDPIGKRINFGGERDGQPVWFQVVGVVTDVRSLELREEASPEFYFTYRQDPWAGMSLVIRTSVEPESLASAVRFAVADVDRSTPISEIRTMEQRVSASVTQPRFNLFLLAIFGGIALLLSAAGIYAVTAYSVAQRTHEVGIRMALGAQRRDVLKLIVGGGMGLIGLGIVIGTVAAFALTRLLRSALFGVSATDPLTFVAITLALGAVALLACYIPARRATRVDPLEALRCE
jgi:putative ABC transport system permease protein